MEYSVSMASTAKEHFDELYDGVNAVVFTDFPDYPNVGDSAIALGQLKYLDESHIDVRGVYSIQTLFDGVMDARSPVMINGGGNICGLYPIIDEHRYRLATLLRKETMLIQAPQSIYIPSVHDRTKLVSSLLSRGNTRIAVRDETSRSILQDLGCDPLLVPDAVHFLGALHSEPPTKDMVILLRRDQESTACSDISGAIDWVSDSAKRRAMPAIRRRLAPVYRRHNLSPGLPYWRKIANRNLQRGISLLSPGRTIVTDRLHAMLLGLQMGRDVRMVDNVTGKARNYYRTWLEGSTDKVKFYHTAEEALNG